MAKAVQGHYVITGRNKRSLPVQPVSAHLWWLDGSKSSEHPKSTYSTLQVRASFDIIKHTFYCPVMYIVWIKYQSSS